MSGAQPENVYSSEATTVVIAVSWRFQQKVMIALSLRVSPKKTCRLITQTEEISDDGPGKAKMGVRAYKTTQFNTMFQ